MASVLGRHAGHVVAAPLPDRQVLVLLACAVALLGLLWVPVLGDRFTGFLSRKLPRAAPLILSVGLGILVIGLVARVRILDVVGACMIGGLVLGAILDNY